MNAQHTKNAAPYNSPDIEQFGIDPELKACMAEVSAVLRRHKLEGRIGLEVLHDHFPVAAAEILYETHDAGKRELMLSPVQRATVDPEKVFVSGWDPTTARALRICSSNFNCEL